MPLTTQLVTKWSEGIAQSSQNLVIDNVVIDSRQAKSGSLFVALKGEHVDGHNYVDVACQQGASAALVERTFDSQLAQIKVQDTYAAMPKLAAAYRNSLQAKIAAVTGSCGKTTTKQMLLSILQKVGKTSATLGNQNNELGVPLTLLNASADDDYLIVEMGASQQGDIAHLMSIANPDVVAVTNAQEAHVGRFGSLQNIVAAKGEIYTGAKSDAILVVNADDEAKQVWLDSVDEQQVILFSVADKSADVFAEDIKVNALSISFNLCYQSSRKNVSLPILGKHNIANALCASAMAFALGVNFDVVVDGLQSFQQVSGRGQVLNGLNGSKVIDDSYNANPSSVKASADMLEQFSGKKLLVLGEMAELGSFKDELFESVANHLANKKVDEVITVGTDVKLVSEKLSCGRHFTHQSDALGYLKDKLTADVVVLFKASRSAHFENMVNAVLQETAQ